MNKELVKIKRALISVYDKTGIVDFAKELDSMGVEILSSGGTAKALAEGGLKVKDVSEYTGFPEMMDGRVKTLHPKVHGGILALRDNEMHVKQAEENGIEFIDLVVVNLYPFSDVIKNDGVELDEAVENIDIGGPTMVRSAAKNFGWTASVVDPADYEGIISEMKEKEGLSFETRENLSYKAFGHTAVYDSNIYNYLAGQKEKFPELLNLNYKKLYGMRYGENPHQDACFYGEKDTKVACVPKAKVLHGKKLSFNNVYDADAALEIVKEFSQPAAVVVKHANPCGVSAHEDINTAFKQAYAADSLSAFGGVISLNRKCTEEIAEEINKVFAEIIIAPGYSEKAFEILTEKKNIRILEVSNLDKNLSGYDLKKVEGGILIQDSDTLEIKKDDLKIVSEKKPTDEQIEEMLFAWKVLKHIKSNGILITKNKTTVGVGAGQVSRVDAVDLAIKKGRENIKESILASDGFFPFRDSIDKISKTGITAVIQPGGSIKDEDVIKAIDEYGMVMAFTGSRAFKH